MRGSNGVKMSEMFAKPFKTPFDEIDLSFSPSLRGGPLRDRLLELQNLFGRVSEMSAIASKRLDESEARYKLSCYIALSAISEMHSGDRSYTAARKEAMVKNWDVLIPGDKEKTTPYSEEMKYFSYKYMAQRGKDKIKELSSAIDLGRSVLSWDKQEVDRMER